MTAFTENTLPELGQTRLGQKLSRWTHLIVHAATSMADKAAERRKAIREARSMAQMNDHLLRDIGVTRNQIDSTLVQNGALPESMRSPTAFHGPLF